MLTDLPLSELRGYVPDVAEPADFDQFQSRQRVTAPPPPPCHPPLFTGAACAGDAVRHHPAAQGLLLVTTGGSQGGGLAIVAAPLADDVRATMPDVPFLAHPRRAVEVTASHPY